MMPRHVGWMLATGLVLASTFSVGIFAQSTTASGRLPAVMWHQKTARFSEEVPATGFPLEARRSAPHCSADGLTFFDVYKEAAGLNVPDLYRVDVGGEVRTLPRKIPLEFNTVSVRDFFAGDDRLVTLLEAENRDSDGNNASHDEEFFLSTSDHDGDNADLVRLDVRFKPLKVAAFGSGDYLILGWDKVHLLPVLALVKQDGTVRRFMDLDSGKDAVANGLQDYHSLEEVASSSHIQGLLKSLMSSSLAPFGKQVLLIYPGTARPLHVLSEVGEERTIPIALPAGFLLHDVLNSGVHWTVLVRAQAAEDFASGDQAEAKVPRQRLFEFNATHGALNTEYVLSKPTVNQVTCGTHARLTAMYPQTLTGSETGNGLAGPAASTIPAAQYFAIATSPVN